MRKFLGFVVACVLGMSFSSQAGGVKNFDNLGISSTSTTVKTAFNSIFDGINRAGDIL